MSTLDGINDILLNRDKVYILPTGFGLAFTFINFAVIMAAATYTNNLVYLLAFALFTIWLLSLIQTHFNIKSLNIEDIHVESAHVGQDVQVQVIMKNPSVMDANFVTARIKVAKQKRPAACEPIVVKANDTMHAQFSLPTTRRGIFKITGVTIRSVFPLGLWGAWKFVRIPREYYVFPALEGHQEMPAPLSTARGHDGNQISQGEDFSGHRSYVVGDSVRHVDWKAHARTGQMLVKKFEDGGEQTFMLRWQDVKEVDPELKLSQLAQWVTQAKQKQDAFGISIPDVNIVADRGSSQLKRCLEALARYGSHSV